MVHYIIKERDETDAQFRQKAEQAYSKLQTYLQKLTIPEQELDAVYEGNKTGSFVLYGEKINKEFKNLIIIFSPEELSSVSATAEFRLVKSAGKLYPAIVLYSLDEPFDIDTIDNFTKRSFIHEFIHYLDFLRFKGKHGLIGHVSSKKVQQQYQKDYFNNPQEFNAFYQEGISEYMRGLNTFKNVPKRINAQLPDDFNEFYLIITKKFLRNDFVEGLNDKYKKKLQKRLYDLHQKLLRKYKNANS